MEIFNKSLEEKNEISIFLLNNSIINKYQYGCKKGSATIYALHDLTKNIFSSLDEKQFCMGIFNDLRKAFNTIDHDISVKNWNFMVHRVRRVVISQ